MDEPGDHGTGFATQPRFLERRQQIPRAVPNQTVRDRARHSIRPDGHSLECREILAKSLKDMKNAFDRRY